MMRLLLLLLLVLFPACQDPFAFEPGDPTKPNPPGAPVLASPGAGWNSGVYVYPQDVDFSWRSLPQAEFYQIEVYRDSQLTRLVAGNDRVRGVAATLSFSFGQYFWRVRAASRSWNNYTDWSEVWMFIVPSPAR